MRNDTPPLPMLLLRPADAARALSISPRKLWGLTAEGALPCVRVGRSVRYSPADLAAYVDAQREGGQQ